MLMSTGRPGSGQRPRTLPLAAAAAAAAALALAACGSVQAGAGGAAPARGCSGLRSRDANVAGRRCYGPLAPGLTT